MTSSLRPTPARANVDAAPGSAPGARVCRCGSSPRTHNVQRTDERGFYADAVEGYFGFSYCETCATAKAAEMETARQAAVKAKKEATRNYYRQRALMRNPRPFLLDPDDDSDPLASLIKREGER